MTRHYVTTAAAAHLPQLRVLHASMRRHCAPFRLHVLAEGDEVVRWARAHADVSCDTVAELLWRHPELAPERLPGPPRNGNELACCWRWWYLADVLGERGAPVLAVDADVMFWGSPEPVFEEIDGCRDCPSPAIGGIGTAILPHAFPLPSAGLPGVTMATHRQYGLYNGGFVYFADPAAAALMATYTHRWSKADFFRHANGHQTWGDQGHLERVREEVGAHVIEHPGACPGPWNIHTQALERRDDGGLDFGGRPLVAYHYQSYKHGRQLADAPYEVSGRQAALLYAPYARELIAAGA